MKRPLATLLTDTIILGLCIAAILLISSKTIGSGSGYLRYMTTTGPTLLTYTNREILVQGPWGHPYHYLDGKAHTRFGLSHQELYPSKAHFQCKWLDRLPAQPSPADHCRRECRSHGGR